MSCGRSEGLEFTGGTIVFLRALEECLEAMSIDGLSDLTRSIQHMHVHELATRATSK